MNRPLVLSLIVTASLLVLTPAAIASPRPDHSHRHHDSSDWAGSGDGRGDLHRRDAVWSFYDNRDDDDSDSSDDSSDDSDSDSSDEATTGTGGAILAPETGTQAVAGGTILSGAEQSVKIQLTAFAAPDNNPAGSKTISQPTIHSQAGGSCTFSDPVSFASPGSAGSTEFPKGQRVYFPSLKCYGVSEDSGATKMSIKHIDIWAGDGPASITDKCESDLTGPTTVIVNPAAGKPVVSGPLSTSSGCTVAARSR
jgi:hypothetical protein